MLSRRELLKRYIPVCLTLSPISFGFFSEKQVTLTTHIDGLDQALLADEKYLDSKGFKRLKQTFTQSGRLLKTIRSSKDNSILIQHTFASRSDAASWIHSADRFVKWQSFRNSGIKFTRKIS
jgi:hypothetical protein